MPDEPEGTKPEGSEPKNFDESYVKELRGEAAGYRVERNDLRKQVEDLSNKVKGFEDSNKSEIEKITERAATAEKALEAKEREIVEAQIRYKVVSEATKLNIVDPDAAYKLIDLSLISEDPKSVKKTLEALVKDKPFLVKDSTPPTPGVGGPPVKGKMTPNEAWFQMLKSGIKK